MSPQRCTALAVDFYFDLVCPWCWIGLRQLQSARERLRASHGLEVEVRWLSFPLLPHLPREGSPYQEFYLRRLGGPAALAHRRAQIQAAGQGIIPRLAFERIRTMPNTVLAHRLLEFARQAGADIPALLEVLFDAWFTQGRDIGDGAVLQELAAPYVRNATGLAAWLADETGWELARQAALAPRGDIGGVPCIVMQGRAPLGGVTSADYMHHWLGQASRAA